MPRTASTQLIAHREEGGVCMKPLSLPSILFDTGVLSRIQYKKSRIPTQTQIPPPSLSCLQDVLMFCGGTDLVRVFKFLRSTPLEGAHFLQCLDGQEPETSQNKQTNKQTSMK